MDNIGPLEERVTADLAVRAVELEQQRWARDERVRRNKEAAAAAAAAAAAVAEEAAAGGDGDTGGTGGGGGGDSEDRVNPADTVSRESDAVSCEDVSFRVGESCVLFFPF